MARRPEPLAWRFRNSYRVDAVTGCWVWTKALMPSGYGNLWLFETKKKVAAHRLSYELHNGPIPAGLHIDHLCRNRACVNPNHLEAVTQAENNRRMFEGRETCKKGHPRTEDNLVRDGAYLRCRECRRATARATYRRKVERSVA